MANTGEQGWNGLKKRVKSGKFAHQAVDINNKLVSVTGLPQAKKENVDTDPDYIAPVLNTGACPVDPSDEIILTITPSFDDVENKFVFNTTLSESLDNDLNISFSYTFYEGGR